MKTKEINILVLAYLGDAIYEQYIREHLIKKGIAKVNDLQKAAVEYVSARAQAKYLTELLELNMLNDEETAVVMRGRNNKSKGRPKHTDIITYKHATALEALIGYLYMEKEEDKIDKIMKFIVGE